MQYPSLNEIPTTRDLISSFGGYNHNIQIGENEFYDMKNMTSDYFPILSPRSKRGIYKYPEGSICSNPNGLSQKDALCYVDGGKLYINNREITDFDLNDEPKRLVSMGAYLLVFPDKKYINTENTEDKGLIEIDENNEGTKNKTVTLSLCTLSGETYDSLEEPSDTAPDELTNGKFWIDSSGESDVLKQWSEANKSWTSVATTYIKIACANIGAYFSRYDAITITGLPEGLSQLSGLNNVPIIVYESYHDEGDEEKNRAEGTNDYLIIAGMLSRGTTLEGVTFTRKMPELDFIIESGNRLWGCRYGNDVNGNMVNEIYASKLGDFKNWNCFMGIASDSYTVSLGTDGPFTGAISHNGYPIFFKENYLHKIYGQMPSNYQVQTIPCNGVQKGSDRSLAIVNTVLYYKSRRSICAYDGSLPQEIGGALGEKQYFDAVAGATDNKYYISMKDGGAQYHLFVYDTKLGLWHKEDNVRADGFCLCDGFLYFIDYDAKQIKIINPAQENAEENEFEWYVETGPIGTSYIDSKYISKLNVRMTLAIGSVARFMIQYDSEREWTALCNLTGHNLQSFTIPIKPKRCDHFRLKIVGRGEAKIFSISKTIEQGSDAQ